MDGPQSRVQKSTRDCANFCVVVFLAHLYYQRQDTPKYTIESNNHQSTFCGFCKHYLLSPLWNLHGVFLGRQVSSLKHTETNMAPKK